MCAVAPPFLRELHTQALERWVPRWLRAFSDTDHGGFHERLDHAWCPVRPGHKRLLTQCRQIYVYSKAALLTGDKAYTAPLHAAVDFLRRSYFRPAFGTWVFSVHTDGSVCDPEFDLYGHAFVILALAHYQCATDDARAGHLLNATLQAIDTHFRAPVGFFEGLRPDATPATRVRRQNSHMHLLEGCLWAHHLTGAPLARDVAREVVALFLTSFFDASNGTLIEFFAADWTPDPQTGHVLEPGHHYEWVWLLSTYLELESASAHAGRIRSASAALATWASRHGWDAAEGGMFDEVRRSDGRVLQPTKRIWHVTEALKAACIETSTPAAATVASTLRAYVAPEGGWVETMHRGMTPAVRAMPGTTPYHLLTGITEAFRLSSRKAG